MRVRDVSNLDLLSWIPIGAHRILDVGCGDGARGAEYKCRNPIASVFGIELSPTAARQAMQRLDRVYISDIEKAPVPFSDDVAKSALDCLIYDGTLDNIQDPRSVLEQHMEFLADDGTVLVCTLNLEYWSLTERLLKGTLYHGGPPSFGARCLPGFTSDGMRHLLHSVGLTAVDFEARILNQPACEAFIRKFAAGLTKLGIEPVAYQQRAAAVQHIWRAGRRPIVGRNLTVVSTMLNPVGGVSDVRVVEPMRALRAYPNIATTIITNNEIPPVVRDDPRIIILHRPALTGHSGLEKVKTLLALGWVVVCEFDDHPGYIPVLKRPDVLNFTGVHAIQTTTETLASVLRPHNSEVVVFENAIARLPPIRNFSANHKIRLLLAGLNREAEWPPYIRAFNSLAQRFGSRLHFEILNDRALFEAIRTEHKNFTPLCAYETYHEVLSKCEISFMPLSDTEFNRCKSDLKFIEAAAHRVVAVANKVVYQDSIKNGRTGILFDTPDELESSLARLVANPDIARSIADAGRRYVREERMLAYQMPRRAAWYHSLWMRRDALTRALLLRVPKLA